MSERTAPGESDTPYRYTAALADTIETAWQDRWEELGTFHADNPVGALAGPGAEKEKFFLLDMFPYPSGKGLHVGHPLGYIATDVVARFTRMTGKNVLYTMGYDAFGLPAEQYAVQTGQHPRISTEANIANMRRQLRRLGLSHDPRRSLATIDADYVRWTQWIFLKIFNSWFDPDAPRRDGRGTGAARPIAELVGKLERGEVPTPDGRPWAQLSEGERADVIALLQPRPDGLTVLVIPRDLFIGPSFFERRRLAVSYLSGPQSTVDLLCSELGVTTTHLITVDMAQFARIVDAAGNVLEPARPPKPGRAVTNRDAETDAIVAAMRSHRAHAGRLVAQEVPAPTERRVVPAGPERFAYRAAEGEKWVDVNLTDSTLTAYEGQKVVYGPILINHGGVGHETVTGTYHVYLKRAEQDMGCTPEWPYCERDVPWIAYWYKDYALHGAPWVKEFGIGTDESSHGCINIPVEDAHWIHDWVQIGTTVVTHR